MAHKIIVLSGKGGVGKSTFTSHLSYGLALDQTKQVSATIYNLLIILKHLSFKQCLIYTSLSFKKYGFNNK